MSSTNQYGSRDAWWRTQRIRGAVRGASIQQGIKVTPGGPSGSASSPASMMIDTGYISLLGNLQTAPGAPTDVSAVAGNAQATVSFTAPVSNGGATITGYTVTSSPGGFTATGATSPLTVTGLTNGTAYTFTVVATNRIGNSVASAPSSAVTPATAPGAPTGVSATAGDAQATVSFTAPVSNGGATITGYTVTSSPGGFTATGVTSPLTVTGLTNGTAYTFTVVATNSVGNSAPSIASGPVTPVLTVLGPTRQVFSTAGPGSWTAPAGVTEIEYLVVGGGGGGGGGSGTGAGGGGGGGSVKTGTLTVVPGQVYNYTVGAGGAGGTGSSGGEGPGVSGIDTVFGVVTAKGGGLGYNSRATNSSSSYGHGGLAQSGDTPTTGGSGGNVRDGGGNPDQGAGGGGGGAGGAGTTSTSNGSDNNAGGAGGIGVSSSLLDGVTAVQYGKGGRGAYEGTSTYINNNGGATGANGVVNTGMGGGGGASHNAGGNGAPGGAGGSGVIVITY